jgi:hypothetical protein
MAAVVSLMRGSKQLRTTKEPRVWSLGNTQFKCRQRKLAPAKRNLRFMSSSTFRLKPGDRLNRRTFPTSPFDLAALHGQVSDRKTDSASSSK